MNTVNTIGLLLMVLLSACGKDRKAMQPAGLEALPSEQRALLESGMSEFNNVLETDIISTNNSGYTVNFSVQSQEVLNGMAGGLKEHSVRNGYAENAPDSCMVSLSESLFKPEKRQILLTVIIHELGHCAGLRHNGSFGKIMSESPAAFSTYSPEVIAEFRADLRSVLGLE